MGSFSWSPHRLVCLRAIHRSGTRLAAAGLECHFEREKFDMLRFDSDTDLPRVLVLSDEIPQTVFAGGIILHRLFAGYSEQPEIEVCRSDLGEESRISVSKLPSSASPSAKLFVIGPKPHPDAKLLDCPYREMPMPLRRLELSRFSIWKRSFQALGLIPLPTHRKVMRMLCDFRPEVVVTIMQGTPFMCLAERTARKLGVPLVLIVHDLNEQFEKVYPWAKKALFKVNRRVYRSAARRLCVSPEMAEYMEGRYGVPGEVMYPNRSEELRPRPLAMSLTLRAEIAAATPEDRR